MKWVLFFLFCSVVLCAAPPEWIGKVLAIEGTAVAEKSSEVRDLVVNSNIFSAETISVGENSKLQIRFTDGGLVDLIQNTIFKVNEYRYRLRGQKDRFEGELIQGGLRSLSGSIPKKNPQNYQLATPTSVMGLRGTLFAINITDTGTFFGVEKGTIEISNLGGKILIGDKQSRKFARVLSKEEGPEELSVRPPELKINLFTPPPGGIDLGQHVVTPGSGIPKAPVGVEPSSTSSQQDATTTSTTSTATEGQDTSTATEGQDTTAAPTDTTTAPTDTTTTPTDTTAAPTDTTTAPTDTTSPFPSSDSSLTLPGGGAGGGGVSIQGGC